MIGWIELLPNLFMDSLGGEVVLITTVISGPRSVVYRDSEIFSPLNDDLPMRNVIVSLIPITILLH